MSNNSAVYRVTFLNQGEVYEVYARSVGQGNLFGFIEIRELVFGEKSSMVIDPGEEKLMKEFEDVVSTFIPMHSVIRIDEVKKQGHAKVTAVDSNHSNVTPFPVYTPKSDQ